MNSDDLFWLRIWQTIAFTFCVMVLAFGGCTANTHYQIARALDKGIDPLLVACAHGNDGASTWCEIASAKR